MEGSYAMLRGQEAKMSEQREGQVLLDVALAVLVDRAGGSVEYTQSEYEAAKARRGPFQVEAVVDKSGPGEPVVRLAIKPSTKVDTKAPIS
jgi:hypothetical protein